MTTTYFVANEDTATPIAQRLVVWAKHDMRVRTTHTGDGKLAFWFDNSIVGTGAGQYPPAVPTGGAGVTIVPASDNSFALAYDQVTGIDPNDYTTTKAAPTALAAVALPDSPGMALLSWTYDQRHTMFRLRFRTAATVAPDPVTPAGEWHFVDIPGYKRNHRIATAVGGKALEYQLQAKVTEGHYVPITSTVTANVPAPA